MSTFATPLGLLRIGRRSLRGSASLRIGIGLLVVLVGFGLVASFALADPLKQNLLAGYARPWSLHHPMGTDQLGRDIFAWVGAGILTSLKVSISVVLISAVVGSLIGLTAGYAGGALDAVLMRLVDLQLAIPPLVLFIAASAVVSGGMFHLILLLSVVGWVPYARIVRSRILVTRGNGYVAAARLAGARRPRMLLVHLLPSAVSEVLVLSSLQAGYVLLWEAGLSFLGLGLQPPDVSLGFLIFQGRADLAEAWWIVTFPGIAIALLVLAFNLIGDGLRDAFSLDPKIVER